MQQPPNYPNQYPPQPNTYYPPQQPPFQQPMLPPQGPPPKKKSKVGLIVAIIAGVLVLACVIAGVAALAGSKSANTGTAESTSTSSTATTAPTTSTSNQHFQVGQTVKVGDTWQITINSAKTSHGSEFNQPKSGNVFLILQITAKNLSASEQNISSLVQFTLTDASGQKYNQTIDSDAGAGLDGKIEAGSQLKGSIVWEVPASIHSYQMAFEADFTSAGQTIWDIKV